MFIFMVHITESSALADHCRPFVFSFPGDKDYISPCDHEHKERCDRCDILPRVVDEIPSAFENIDDGAKKDEMKFQGEQSMQKISVWKAHILSFFKPRSSSIGCSRKSESNICSTCS